MVLDKALCEIKDKIIKTNLEIEKACSKQRKRQLLKHKHKLEKEVMAYMNLKYGVIMRREKYERF